MPCLLRVALFCLAILFSLTATAGGALQLDAQAPGQRATAYIDLLEDPQHQYRLSDIERPELPKGASYVSPFGEMVANDILPKAASQS